MSTATEFLPGWKREMIAGHEAEIFEPPQPNEHGYTVIYLHGVHLKTLADNAVYTNLFARHGLRVVVPKTGRSWWADRICREFDPAVTADQYVRSGVLPFIQERFGAVPPRLALLGTSMG
ncbi:MAG: esterase, partial [Singulisphaera sp.]